MQTAGKDATVRRLMNENSTLMGENSILRAEIERLRASNKEQRGQTTLALDLVSTRNRDDLPPGFRTIDKLRDWLPIWREPSHCHALLHPIALGCGRLDTIGSLSDDLGTGPSQSHQHLLVMLGLDNTNRSCAMPNNIIWIIGLVVIVLALLGYFGFR
jgi:hypothetical protein